MGEAKNRGKYEERVTAAKTRLEAEKPKSLTCGECKTKLTDIQTLDSRGLKGIEAAFAAYCPECGHNTWAMKGDPQAIAIAMDIIRQESGGTQVGHFGPEGWPKNTT